MYSFLCFFGFLFLINLVRYLGVCTKTLEDKAFEGKFFKIGTIIAYVLSFLWVASAVMVQVYGDRCSPFTPDFQNKFCFFSGKNVNLWIFWDILNLNTIIYGINLIKQ